MAVNHAVPRDIDGGTTVNKEHSTDHGNDKIVFFSFLFSLLNVRLDASSIGIGHALKHKFRV